MISQDQNLGQMIYWQCTLDDDTLWLIESVEQVLNELCMFDF